MFSFSRFAALALATLLAVCLFGSAPAWAESTVLSGVFDSTESVAVSLSGQGCAQHPLGYLQSTFKVSESGAYSFYDSFGGLRSVGGVDVIAQIYEGSFNASHPGQNLLASGGLEFNPTLVSLAPNMTYVLVVQHMCEARKGTWAVTFVGPGTVSSDSAVVVPSFTQGKFTASDPKMFDGCTGESSGYQQSGPIQVSRTGIYYITDALWYPLVTQACVQIYTAPVNPAYPVLNRLKSSVSVKLNKGQDYYFVVQRAYGDAYGEYFYLLAPPAPLRINPGLAGTWYNPDTPGQGFFLTVYEKLNQVFLGWFTYSQNPPVEDKYHHRWMTAFGPIEGPSADLDIEWTSGGAFNAAQPRPEQHVWGDLHLDFADCSSGELTYAFGPDDTGGYRVESIPIRRPTKDAVALCEPLYAGPGMPGPL